MPAFDELISGALAAAISSWDLGWLDWLQRRTGRLPWSYRRETPRTRHPSCGPHRSGNGTSC